MVIKQVGLDLTRVCSVCVLPDAARYCHRPTNRHVRKGKIMHWITKWIVSHYRDELTWLQMNPRTLAINCHPHLGARSKSNNLIISFDLVVFCYSTWGRLRWSTSTTWRERKGKEKDNSFYSVKIMLLDTLFKKVVLWHLSLSLLSCPGLECSRTPI